MTDFPQKLRPVRKNWWYRWDDSSKVYRYTFSANRELYEQMAEYGEEVYPFWRLPKFTDVTYGYGYNLKKELVIPLEKLYKTKREKHRPSPSNDVFLLKEWNLVRGE